MMAAVSLEDIVKGNNNKRESVGREWEGISDGIEDEDEQAESSSGEEIVFRGKRGYNGSKRISKRFGSILIIKKCN